MNIPHTTPNNNFRCLSHDTLPLYSGTISLCLCSMYNCFLSMTSGFCHKVDENCTLLGYYTASSANLLLTCQHNILVPSLGVRNPKDIMRTMCCPKMLVRNFHYMLHSDTRAQFSTASQISAHTSQRTHTVRILKTV